MRRKRRERERKRTRDLAKWGRFGRKRVGRGSWNGKKDLGTDELRLETVHPDREARKTLVFVTDGETGWKLKTHLIVSFSIPSSIKISKIFCLWSPWSWITLPISSSSTIEPLQANSFLKAFKSFLGSYSEGTPWRVVIVFRPLRCWIRMWIALAVDKQGNKRDYRVSECIQSRMN